MRKRNYVYGEADFALCSLLGTRQLAAVVLLTQEQVAFIDPEDVPLVSGYHWAAHRTSSGGWYARACVRGSIPPGRHIYMHALVSGMAAPDHRDRNGLNNTKANLRPAIHAQNMGNQPKRRGTSSRFKGVSFVPRTGRWQARIGVNGCKHHLGYHLTEEEAARDYDRAAVRHFGEFAATNASLGLLLPAEGGE